ncbi:MAG: hypothetical protein HY664_06785 [Chloroflexi bacterium]|nr:hypothetical protein [Chloroflexota bacterium]
MPDELNTAALAFLKAEAKELENVLPKVNPLMRFVSDRLRPSSLADTTEKQQLEQLLAGKGIRSELLEWGYMRPLRQKWLNLADPFSFNEQEVEPMLNEFVKAVLEKKVLVKWRDWLSIRLKTEKFMFEEAMVIRPSMSNEQTTWLSELFEVSGAVLDFQVECTVDYDGALNEEKFTKLRRLALSALVLAYPGHLYVNPLQSEVVYGTSITSSLRIPISSRSLEVMSRGEKPYILNASLVNRLRELWYKLAEIMWSPEHDFRLPAQRLIDGVARKRDDDAIVDYAIGLEALLLHEINDELRYRFALRGATVLVWDGDRREHFDKLRHFYDVRSAIVHGSYKVKGRKQKLTQMELADARSTGEQALRNIWWWFFDQGTSKLEDVTHKIDDRILEGPVRSV